MSVSDIFGQPLQLDPAVALQVPSIHVPSGYGLARKVQFVVELVGQRVASAASIKSLLDPQWQAALGSPQVFVMAASDQGWRQLGVNDQSGAYDSVLLAWDLMTPGGDLSPVSAQHLWDVAENFARQIGRRAMAMPVPNDIPPTLKVLRELRENLDIGVNLTLVPRTEPFPEREVWKVAAALGLTYSPSGGFQWSAPGIEDPLFELSPGDADQFTLAQVQAGVTHPALGLGFSVPLCPAPDVALNGCFHTAEVFTSRLGATLVDEDFKQVDERAKSRIASELRQAVTALTKAGFPPGSVDAAKLFAP